MTDVVKMVFLDRKGLPQAITAPNFAFPYELVEYPNTRAEQVIERAKDAEIIITSKVPLMADTLAKLPKLKLIAITATGTNNVDLAAAEKLGIAVKNVTGYSNVTVPEHVIGLIFALKHSLMNWYADQLSGKWGKSDVFCYFDHPIKDVCGSTLAIVGKGNLGSEVGRLASALGMKVIYAERPNAEHIREGYVPFVEALRQADVLSLHCPLTPETTHLINAETLSLMKPSALLINTGRGPLVEDHALVQALEQGKLAGAALDVLTVEPPRPDNEIVLAAQKLSNLILTPHIAWASESAVETLVSRVWQNIADFVAEQ